MSFKICVIGCGYISSKSHGPAIQKYAETNKDTELAACCDLNFEKAMLYKKTYGFKNIYTDMDEMLSKENPDAISLICPVDKTKELSISLIQKGYPLILEKPPGLGESQTKDIIDSAKKANLPVMVAFNRRYMPLVQEMKKILNGKEIFHINYNMIRHGRFDEDFSTTSIHAIDLVKYLSGSEYKEVHFIYQDLPECGDKVANIYLNCYLKNGMIANLNFLVASGGAVENVLINGFEETYILKLPISSSYDYPGKIINLSKGYKIGEISLNESMKLYELTGFYGENKTFFDLVKNNKIGYIDDLESSLQSVIIAECIRNRKQEYYF